VGDHGDADGAGNSAASGGDGVRFGFGGREWVPAREIVVHFGFPGGMAFARGGVGFVFGEGEGEGGGGRGCEDLANAGVRGARREHASDSQDVRI